MAALEGLCSVWGGSSSVVGKGGGELGFRLRGGWADLWAESEKVEGVRRFWEMRAMGGWG